MTLKKKLTEQTDHEWQFLQRDEAVPSLGFINTSPTPCLWPLVAIFPRALDAPVLQNLLGLNWMCWP